MSLMLGIDRARGGKATLSAPGTHSATTPDATVEKKESDKAERLSISVVIPVYNASAYLRICLAQLAKSTELPHECLVVDDGSTDNSAEVARQSGATVLSTGGRRGQAYARNLGARAASGTLLLFIDADVCVHTDTLAKVLLNFTNNPQLDALIGSYDDSPGSQDFLSQYRNLMHCFVHQNGRSEASTFWSGCGAIRRSVFLEFSGFDESFRAIEDIELGFRLVQAGRKIALDRQLLARHLKRWTFWNLIKTDILSRGMPWTELILRDRRMPRDLNLQLSQRISVAIVFLSFLTAAIATIWYRGYFLTPLFALLFLSLGAYWVDGEVHSENRAARILMISTFAAIVLAGYTTGLLKLVLPSLSFGYLLLFLRHRYSYLRERQGRVTGVLCGVYVFMAALFIFTLFPRHLLVFCFLSMVLVVAGLNLQFYVFLARRRGRLYALAALPFHLLYHFYNGISFIAGLIRYSWRRLILGLWEKEPARMPGP
jgi:glycosyltransferase involved in cell wall biosynthesis